MKTHFQQLFTFTDSERNGTVVLLVLIAMVSVIISLQSRFISLPKENFSEFDRFIASVKANEKSDSLTGYQEKYSSENKTIPAVSEEASQHSIYHNKELFNFNPNGLPVDDWVRLGLSPAQARSVKNFEAKGGKFETKEDVKKLFVISAERYSELEPFIVLPEKSPKQDSLNRLANSKSNSTNQKLNIPKIIELNTADSTLLVSINGIGPAFANRILAYRERLGGFHSTDQLTEVFGIDAEKYAAIKNSVKADSTYIRKININTAEVSDLRKLPYISPNVASAIVSYRKVHGPYKTVVGIRACVLVSAELYGKIAPYISI